MKITCKFSIGRLTCILAGFVLFGPWSAGAANSEIPLSISQAWEAASTDKKLAAVITGVLVIEPEDRRLWEVGETYAITGGSCVNLEISDDLFDQREEVSRREVQMAGMLVKVPCPDRFCSDPCKGLWLHTTSLKGFGRQPTSSKLFSSNRINIGSLYFNRIERPSRAVRSWARDLQYVAREGRASSNRREKLLRYIGPNSRGLVMEELNRLRSRINWIMFDWQFGVAALAESNNTQIWFYEHPLSKNRSQKAVCFCGGPACHEAAVDLIRVYFRAASDPMLCLPFQEKNGRIDLISSHLVSRRVSDMVRD